MKTQAQLIDEIKRHAEPSEVRRLILDAYNAEILSNRMGRLEQAESPKIMNAAKKDLLLLAIKRVHEVVCVVG